MKDELAEQMMTAEKKVSAVEREASQKQKALEAQCLQLKHDLERAFDVLEKQGLFGEGPIWFCDECDDRVTGKPNVRSGVGYICTICSKPVVGVNSMDPVKLKIETKVLEASLIDHRKQNEAIRGLLKKHKRRAVRLHKLLFRVWRRYNLSKLGRAYTLAWATKGTHKPRGSRSIRI